MQQQKPGQDQQSGQHPNKQQDVRNQGNDNRPEVENPQPTRKVEEPIVGNSMQADNDSRQGGSQDRTKESSSSQSQSGQGGTSSGNQDYQKSNAGFRSENADTDRTGEQGKTNSETSGDNRNRTNN